MKTNKVSSYKYSTDDSCNIAYASSFIDYEPFNKHMPKDQVTLLNLWTELGIPFKEKKQVFGTPLTVIGINVNPNNLTYTLPEKAKSDLLSHCHKWKTFVLSPKAHKMLTPCCESGNSLWFGLIGALMSFLCYGLALQFLPQDLWQRLTKHQNLLNRKDGQTGD